MLNQILDLQLQDVYQRLAGQHLTLHLSSEARQLILDAGYDSANGARPLQRAIERLLTRPLSVKIVEETFHAGDTIVATIAEDNNNLIFKAQNKTDERSTDQPSARTAD
jgi:ATP-dependent Clp protease ATP-binding subunit ClpC